METNTLAGTPPLPEYDLLITGIGLLATPEGSAARAGHEMDNIRLERDVALAVKGSRIGWIGPPQAAPKARRAIDAGGALVTPGLVDCDTHLVFGGWRQHELADKLAGVSYLDFQQRGGGVLDTVAATRGATFDDLYDRSLGFLRQMLELGVTVCEAKSGYGLGLEEELRLLRIIKQLNINQPIQIVPSFCGAHALPADYAENREAYLALVCGQMIPAVAQQKLARFCDVNCEVGAFTAQEAEQVLRAAKGHGLGLKIHAELLEPIGGSVAAAELKAASAAHLIATPIHAMEAMAEAGVVGVLLPVASFYLHKPYARAYEMLKAGMALAVGSGFNPGSAPSLNLQLAMNMACLRYKLSPAQVLTAVTLNAAAAIGLAAHCGSLEVGKQADILIWDAPDLETVCYRLGGNQVKRVILDGREEIAR